MKLLARLKELYSQNNYKDTFDRCDDCEHHRSYYFDEYDADAWCNLEKDTDSECCYSFRKKGGFTSE